MSTILFCYGLFALEKFCHPSRPEIIVQDFINFMESLLMLGISIEHILTLFLTIVYACINHIMCAVSLLG